MSRYAQTLAQARLQALHALQCALLEAATPDEIRRCAVAILNAPDPCEIDDALPHTPGISESVGGASESRGFAPSAAPHPDPLPTSTLPPPNSHLPFPPTASPEDLAQLRSLMSADDAILNRTLRARPEQVSLITPSNIAAIRSFDLAPT